MKHRSNILTRMLSVTLAVSMLFDLNGMTALAESADALLGADSYAVEEALTAEAVSGVAEEALSGAEGSAADDAALTEGTTAGADQSGAGDAELEALFLEPDPVDAQAYAYLGVSEDSDAYQVDTSLGYRVTGVIAVPGHGYADLYYYVNKKINDYMYIIYTEADSDKDFFPDCTSTTTSASTISGYESTYRSWSYGSSENSFSLKNLKEGTAYIYRLALRQGDSNSGYTWYFLTKPASFTVKDAFTKSKVTISDLRVEEYGYTREKISFKVNNPENEDIKFVDVADQGAESTSSQTSTSTSNGSYTCTFRTDEGAKEIRVAVQNGENLEFVRQAVELKKQDMPENGLTFSFSEGSYENTHYVNVEASPLYASDDFYLRLYYREQGAEDTSYTRTGSRLSASTGETHCFFSGSAGKTYEYYTVVEDGSSVISGSAGIGSEEIPKTFTVSADYDDSAVYTYANFKDKALFYYLATKDAEKDWTEWTVSKSELLKKTYLSISGSSSSDIDYAVTGQAISTLEDLDKMPYLTLLSLYGQNITDISKLKEMPFLSSVSLYGNELTELPDLSDCKWTTLNLSDNLLTDDAIAAAKLPETLRKNLGAQGSNTLTIPTDEYMASHIYQGKHRLYVGYDRYGNYKSYAFIITVNGQTSDELTGEYLPGWHAYAIEDIGIDLDPGVEYPATITVKAYGKEVLSQDVVLYYPVVGVGSDTYVAKQDLEQGKDNSIYVNSYASIEKEEDIKSITLLDHDTKEAVVSASSVTFSSSRKAGRTGMEYEYYSFYGKFDLYDVPIGDYDIQVETVDEKKYVMEDKVHIVTSTLISSTGIDDNGYDNTGKYIYISMQYKGADPGCEKVWPVLTSEDGSVEYTEKIWGKRRDSSSYVYKLLKKDNWSDDFGDLNVKLATAEGYPIGDVRSSTTVYVSNIKNIRLKACVYNLRREAFDYYLTDNVSAGTRVLGMLYTEYSNEDSLVATAEGVIDSGHHVSLKYTALDGGTYIPEEHGWMYSKIRIVGQSTYLSGSDYVYYNPGVYPLRLSGTSCYTEGISKLNVYAYCTPGQAETEELYVRLSDGEGNVLAVTPEALRYDANTSGSYNYYRNSAWELGRELAKGTYTLTLYGMVHGEEKAYATKKIYVMGLDTGFWQDTQSISYNNYQGASWQKGIARVIVHLPGFGVEEMDDKAVQSFWEERKLALAVYNADGEEQDVTVTPYKGYASGALNLMVSDLNDDEAGYYFKLTMDGAVAKNPATGEDYYTDEHGTWAARGSYFNFRGNYLWYKDISHEFEYTYFEASDYARDLPYTIDIYRRGNLDKPVKTLTVDQEDLNYNGYYYFTEEDLEGLYLDEVYRLVATSAVGGVRTDDGFVPAKENAPANYDGGDSGEDDPTPVVTKHQVTFYAHGAIHKTLSVEDGKTLDLGSVENPTPAEGEGEFEGWYVGGTDTPWDATQPVTADLKLEAHFKTGGNTGGNSGEGGNEGGNSGGNNGEGGEENPATIQHQIQFYVGDTLYKTLPVKDGDKADMTGVAAPAPAEGQGEFEGWYISGTETLWDASQPVTADLKLEARFKTAGDGDNGGNPGEGGTGTEGDNTEPGESALDVEVNVSAEKGSLYLVKGQKFNLGEGAWISSDPKSLAISKKNEATAKKDAEGITIKAADVNKEYTVSIVTPKLSEVKCTVLVGDDSKTLSVTGLGTNNKYASNYAVYWTSASPEIVTVDDGKLHAMSKGTATVTAYVNGKAYNCKVSVVDAMSIGKLGANASFTLTPMQTTALKFDSGFKLKKAVEWTSTVNGAAVEVTPVLKKNGKVDYYENGIVKITTAGKVTAIGAGTTTLTAKDAAGNTQTFTVTVSEPAEKTIYVNQGSTKTVKLYNVKASALQFKAVGGAGKAELTNGRLQGITAGEASLSAAYIPCETQTGRGFTYTLEVYVEDPSLNAGNGLTQKSGLNYDLTLKKGAKYAIEEKAVYQPVLYKSSKAAVAFVNESGIISARSVGKAKITAKVNGKKVTINVTVTE